MKHSSLCLLILIMLCTSCGVLKPKYITQVQHDTTTVYQNTNTVQHDSIYVFKDRNTFIKGDTVYTTITEYKDKWRFKEVHDTVYKEKSVYVDKKVPVEVVKPLTGIQKFFINFGKLFCAILLVGIGYLGFKTFKKTKL